MEKKPLVSILTPIYGVEKHIEKCAHSLFNQTFRDIEYIFVNDFTIDNSMQILQSVLNEYPERLPYVKIINHKENRGLSVARNTALDNASGKFIWHVDSDDFIAEDAVEKLYNCALDTGADMVVCSFAEVYNKNVLVINEKIPEQKEEYVKLLLLRKKRFEVIIRFCSSEIYTKIRFVEGVGFGEDYAVTPRLAFFANKIVKLDSICYYYVKYNNSSFTRNISLNSIYSISRAQNVLSDFFCSIGAYTDIMPLSSLYLKIHMIKTSAISNNKDALIYLSEAYSEINSKMYNLSFPNRLILYLSQKGYFNFLNYYVKLGVFLRRLL